MVEIKENKKNLKEIRSIVGVLAGKGGVGKSTITNQLARVLNARGMRVGVLDGDIYGPSMRALLTEDEGLRVEGEKVVPARSGGIAVMSAAYLPKGKGNTAVRAPIVTQLISQFIAEVEWGELDVLLVDFPPGTGDIQISLMQKLPFTGALVITTPQELSLLDVRKSAEMCLQMGVPLLGVVENMSYFKEPESEKRHFLFGEGGGRRLSEEFQVPLLAEIPVNPALSQLQGGEGFVLPFETLGKRVLSLFKEEKRFKIKGEDRYHFSIEWLDGVTSFYRYSVIQSHCPCAQCVQKERKLSPNVEGRQIVLVGNYGIQVVFSHGCSKGLYPFTLLKRLGR